MLIFRGAVTQHPRGSTSAPAMSLHYWLPLTSVSSTGVTELQSLLAPFSAAALLHQGMPPLAPSNGERDDVLSLGTRGDYDAAVIAASSQPLNANTSTQPSVETCHSRGLAFVLALLVLVGLLVAMHVVGQSLQSRELVADEWIVTDVGRPPMVQQPSSGHAYGDVAAAVDNDPVPMPAAINRSKTADTDDRLPNATTVITKGHSMLHGRRTRPMKPLVTSSVCRSGVNESVMVATAEWLG